MLPEDLRQIARDRRGPRASLLEEYPVYKIEVRKHQSFRMLGFTVKVSLLTDSAWTPFLQLHDAAGPRIIVIPLHSGRRLPQLHKRTRKKPTALRTQHLAIGRQQLS